jgi:hypothetical protein
MPGADGRQSSVDTFNQGHCCSLRIKLRRIGQTRALLIDKLRSYARVDGYSVPSTSRYSVVAKYQREPGSEVRALLVSSAFAAPGFG